MFEGNIGHIENRESAQKGNSENSTWPKDRSNKQLVVSSVGNKMTCPEQLVACNLQMKVKRDALVAGQSTARGFSKVNGPAHNAHGRKQDDTVW